MTTPTPTKLPWPKDAVMIVAEDRHHVRLDLIQGEPVPATCCQCGRALTGDSHTRDRALALPTRMERPVLYFCIHCATEVYDMNDITELHDDRGGREERN